MPYTKGTIYDTFYHDVFMDVYGAVLPGYSGRCIFEKEEIGDGQIKACSYSALFDSGHVSQHNAVRECRNTQVVFGLFRCV